MVSLPGAWSCLIPRVLSSLTVKRSVHQSVLFLPLYSLFSILVANDKWMKFAYGPMLTHGGTRGAEWWKQRTEEAGFETVEIGGSVGTLYLLLRRPGGI